MTVQALTVGYSMDLGSPAGGVVHSVFPRAVNLLVDGDLWTVLVAGGGDLPFGIRVRHDDLTRLGLCPGDPVAARAGYLGLGRADSGAVIDCRAARRWSPAPNSGLRPGLRHRLDTVAGVAADRSWRCSRLMARNVVAALADPAVLPGVVARVIGRGPGLTPAGDDVLVGVLAVLTSPWAGVIGADAARAVNASIDVLIPGTTDVSAHLLRQAGNGLFSRALDDLLVAVASAGTADEVLAAAGNVIRSGATSGADTCMGVLEAAPSFLLLDEKAAA